MSTLSKTPDDKMHRYLQRIEKLVGHRGKSPVLMKSRTKSPFNIKTSRIDSYLKHQMLFKTIFRVCDQYHKKIKAYLIEQLALINREAERNCFQQRKNITNIPRKIQRSQQASFVPRQQQRIIVSKPHRRTYSQIYAESVTKYNHMGYQERTSSKSPSTVRNYEYRTPEVFKNKQEQQDLGNGNDQMEVFERVKAMIMFLSLQKVLNRTKQSSANEIRQFSVKSNLRQHSQKLQEVIQQLQNQINSLTKQHLVTIEKLNLSLAQNQRRSKELKVLKESKSSSSQLQEEIIFLQNKLYEQEFVNRMNVAAFKVSGLMEKKVIVAKADAVRKIMDFVKEKNDANIYGENSHLHRQISHTNHLLIHKTLKFILLRQLQSTLNYIRSYKPFKHSESREVITTQTYQHQTVTQRPTSHPYVQSLYSSKHSYSSKKSSSSNFDLFAKKVNKAFQLNRVLKEIYSHAFQKIDETAFWYLTLAGPIKKVLKSTLTESFRKILFYSFYKSQSINDKGGFGRSPMQISMIASQNDKKQRTTNYTPLPPTPKSSYSHPTFYQQTPSYKLITLLTKIQKKILIQKIQAYSSLKLNSELKKTHNIQEDVVISRNELKREIKDFLQQRNSMHQKTFDTWQKTKEMLQELRVTDSRENFLTHSNSNIMEAAGQRVDQNLKASLQQANLLESINQNSQG